MHVSSRKTLFVLCLLPFLAISSASGTDSQKQLEHVAEQAISAREKLMQQDAAPADVNTFLAFGTDNLIYEDPVVMMRIEGKDQIRKGLLSFLGVSRQARIVVTKRIAVANVVVFEQIVSFEEQQSDNKWKPQSRRQVTIFEFEGSRIRRISDYWSR